MMWALLGLLALPFVALALAVMVAERRKCAAADALLLPGDPDDSVIIESEPLRGSLMLSLLHGKTFMLHVTGVWRGYFGQPQIVATCQPELARELLRNRAHAEVRAERYKAGMFLPGLAGVLWMEGEPWREHTAALRPVFHGANFGRHAASFAREAHTCLQTWTEGQVRPLLQSLRDIAMRHLLVAGYGLDPHSSLAHTLRAAIEGYDEKKRLAGVADGARLLSLPRFLRGFVQIYFDAQRIRAAVAECCAARRTPTPEQNKTAQPIGEDSDPSAPAVEGAGACDWIGRMLECGLSEREIFNEVNHLHAAHKAIALVLTFTVVELTRAPTDMVDAVRSELSDRLSSTGRGYHSREDLGELPLTMALWKEALRLHPVAIGVMRETGEAVELPKVGVSLPKGTPVVILLQAMHMHPDYWDEPEAFDPGRWIRAEDTSAMRTASDNGTRSAFIPFLDGQRQCAGRFLAELEFVAVLHALLQRLDFSAMSFPPDEEMPLVSDPYPTFRDPPQLTVRLRAAATS